MITITTTTTVQAVLAGTVATAQPTYWSDFIDTADDAVGQKDGTLSNTTDVDIVAAPSSGDRLVRQIHIYNADSASVTVTVKTDAGGTERKLITSTLATGQSLIYNSSNGWVVGTLTGAGTYQPIDSTLTAISNDGAVDFGGFTSFEIPNGAGGTTVDAAGEVCVDTTSRTINFYDGTAEVVLNPLRTFAVLILAPIATDDLPVFRFEAAATIVKTIYAITGGTNWVGQVQEANDAQGTSAADTQAADSTVTGTTTVTSFSNASFDAGDYAFLKTTSVSGSVTWLHVQVWYRENA